MSYLFSRGSVNADLKGSMVFDLHKQADMLELSAAAGEIDRTYAFIDPPTP
ncbi:hypothetical protein [Nostoc sp.]